MSIHSFDLLPEVSAVLDALTEPAALLSLDYQILATNNAYQEHFRAKQEIIGRHCYEVSHGYDLPCDQEGESCPLKRCVETGARQRMLHIHNTPHGQEHVDVEMAPVHSSEGALVYFLEVMHLVKVARPTAEGSGMVGRSAAFNQMLSFLQRAAPSEISVLLLGESGTGKELVARALHDQSKRASGPFVTVECSGLSESLFESELFGHERGAFTGAVNRKQGLVAAARGGTLFLDEIGDVPLSLQVKLLRLIETGTYRTVGGVELQHADFRLVCATHRHLETMVEGGTFRRDLFYRISAFPIELPSLVERVDDIPLLVDVLLKRIPEAETKSLSPAALGALRRYTFPGNIRELRNILERAVLLSDDNQIDLPHLPPAVANFDRIPIAEADDSIKSLEQVEQEYLLSLKRRFAGDNRGLAQALGISERTLYRKLKSI
ncbi:sigma-54-dependent Fis family transcriptional regulator [Pontibacterium granulatum]|uniref:sigma-54 interaction domain-containing protein n=1 Tax=Pontibacterium granulatum TaxID=2036029 RepID=UPI00249BB10F|nr:sigma-54-dependent Fis family transcriptional regulator [Pontibacterium granulatum]MDI3325478.1 sigma-54-dependent Fis family transcriptional regulator [Pontibacterium granulatum]